MSQADQPGILKAQFRKQLILGRDPRHMSRAEIIDYVRGNVLAAIKELTEVLDEVGWKSWGTSDHFNRREFAEEITDVQLFLDNLKLALLNQGEGSQWLNPDQLEEHFAGLTYAKIQNAIDRHNSGNYDGFKK